MTIEIVPQVVREAHEAAFARYLAENCLVECPEETGATVCFDRIQKAEGNVTVDWLFKRWTRPA